MVKNSKRFLAWIIALILSISSVPVFVNADAPLSGTPGEFYEDFSGFSAGNINLNDLDGLKMWGSNAGAAEVVNDASASDGKALRLTDAQIHTKENTPDNFKLEYKFKVVNKEGDWATFFNWLDAPDSGNGEGGALFGYDPESWRGANYHLLSGWDQYSNNPIITYDDLGNTWHKLTIIYYEGTYTLYMDDVKIDERNFGPRINKGLHFKINTLDMYFDYIKVEVYSEGGGTTPTEPLIDTWAISGGTFDNYTFPGGYDGWLYQSYSTANGGTYTPATLKFDDYGDVISVDSSYAYALFWTYNILPRNGQDAVFTYTVPRDGMVDLLSTLQGPLGASGPATGINAAIYHNGTKIWPENGDWYFAARRSNTEIELNDIAVKSGDKLHFRLSVYDSHDAANPMWDPHVVYTSYGSAPPSGVPGEFYEDFSGFSVGNVNLNDLDGLKMWGSNAGVAEIVSDASASDGKALHITNTELHTKADTPDNFKLEYRFKVVNQNDGWPAFHNWLGAPDGGNGEGGPMFGYEPTNWRGSNYHLLWGWDKYDGSEIIRNADFGNAWHKLTITFYNGLYTMYMNEEKIGERSGGDWSPRTNKALHFNIRTLEMLFDYIEVSAYDGSNPFPLVKPAVPGEFNEDFDSFDVGETFNRDGNSVLGGLRVYDEGFGATAMIVDDQDTGNGKALYVDAAAAQGATGDTYQYKSFTLITQEKVPENFQLEYRFKLTSGNGGWREFVNWLDATDVYGDWDPSGPAFTYNFSATQNLRSYYLQREYNSATNELRKPAGAFEFNDWHTVKITYWKGTYTLYMDGIQIGERNYSLRNEDYIRFRVGTINMYIDYVKLEAYEETNAQPPSLAVAFNKTGHIFTTAETTAFDLVYESNTSANSTVDISYVVKNHKDIIVQQGAENGVSVASMGKVERKINLNQITGTGIFTVTVTANAGGGNIVSKSAEFSRVFPVIADRKGEPFGNCAHLSTRSEGVVSTSMGFLELGGNSIYRDDFAWQSAETQVNGTINIPASWHRSVDAAKDRGIETLAIISYGNTNYQTIDPGMRNRGIPITDAGRKAYARFALELVKELYPKGVRYFEVWNEPNHQGGGTAPFNPNGATAADYTALLKEVYTTIKPIYPDVQLLSASTAPFNNLVDSVFIKGMLDAGAMPYIDIISIHPYTYSNGASAEDRNLVYWLEQLDVLIRQYNDNVSVPIWVTEFGWPTHLNSRDGVSEEVSASYMVRSYTQILSLDFMEKIICYNYQNSGNNADYNEDNFGQLRHANDPNLPWGAKATYVAQNVMANLLYKAEYVSSNNSGNVYSYKFKRADGKDVIVTWDTAGERNSNISVGNGEFKIYDMYGDETTVQVNNGAIDVGISKLPIYIVGDMSGALVSDPELLKFKPAYEDGEWFIEANIKNSSDDPMSGTIRITTPAVLQSEAVTFDSIPANSAAKVRIPVSNPGLELYNITVRADITDYGIVTENRATSFLRAEKASKALTIDGVLDPNEWQDAQEIVLNQANQTRSGASMTQQMQGWGGEEDLSAKIYLKWDNDNLYMGVEVKDNIHSQSYTGGNTWQGDSVQFTFDQGRAAGINSQGFSHIVMAMTNGGIVENWRVESAHGGENAVIPDNLMKTEINRNANDNTTIYEASISWELLGGDGMITEINSLFGFSLLVNDNDSNGRRGWIQYMDGIGFGGRNPNLFGDLLLVVSEKEPITVTKKPYAIQNFDATTTAGEVDAGTVTFTWTNPNNESSAVESYELYLTNGGNKWLDTPVIINTTDTTATLTFEELGITKSGDYDFRIKAVNALGTAPFVYLGGESRYKLSVVVEVPEPTAKPKLITNFNAVLSGEAITFSWVNPNPEKSATTVETYSLYKTSGGSVWLEEAITINAAQTSVSEGITSITLTFEELGIAKSGNYDFRIKARNSIDAASYVYIGGENRYKVKVEIESLIPTAKPKAVTNFNATSDGETVTFTWINPNNSATAVESYELTRTNTGNTWQNPITIEASKITVDEGITSATFTLEELGIDKNGSYDFRIKAINDEGVSALTYLGGGTSSDVNRYRLNVAINVPSVD